MRGLWLAISALTLSLGTTGCELISSVDRSKVDNSGGTGGAPTTGGSAGTGGSPTTGGTGGTGGTGAMGGSGGSGGAPECTVADDCMDPGNECLVKGCTDGKCVPTNVTTGTPVGMQKAGDCQQVVCDGNGSTTSQADDSDIPVDGKDCTDDMCTGGVPSNPAKMANAACGQGGALFCDGNGECVGCTMASQCGTATDCSTPACNAGKCGTNFASPGTPVPMQVMGDCQVVECDGLGGTKIIPDNSDIADDGNQCTEDICAAGAPTHPNSASGKACTDNNGIKCNGSGACVECLKGSDCSSLVCQIQACVAPSCMDAVKNAGETDVDCGGADCAPCGNGKACAAATDCTSSVCSGSPLKCQTPTCIDVVKNGTETDVDCGGAACPKCGPTKACKVNADCLGGTCTGNTCVPTCTDMSKNGTETDVDCGGSCATKCATGKACGANSDCAAGVCTNNVCQAATCSDNVKNGSETDVDCGGPLCADCADGKACSVNGDCVSGKCTGSICQMATCMDGVKNGQETDVDCGGPTCGACVNGKACSVNGDCVNGTCLNNVCGMPTCNDSVKNGQETDVDCGGPTCPKCANGKTCSAATDCTSTFCNVTCQPPPADIDPANDTCAGASSQTLPASLSGLHILTINDVDWYMFTATAADVGKLVHVVTTSPPPGNAADTLVEVFAGASCATQVSLGGPSDDASYSENWLSAPITAAGPFWVKVSNSTYGFSQANYSLAVSLEANSDNDPANDTCAGATALTLPAMLTGLQLPTETDVDWFTFTATAADVGKKVHVVTTGSGTFPCDTVVNVYAGASCASQASLGGPSSDAGYNEDFLSSPIAAAGPVWVKVYNSSFGHTSSPYVLSVTLQ